MTKPNPCPFCGYQNIKVGSKRKKTSYNYEQAVLYSHYCVCNKCHAKGPVTTVTIPCSSSKTIKESKLETSQEKVIHLWNQRR